MLKPDYTYELQRLNLNLGAAIVYLESRIKMDGYNELVKCGIISQKQYADIMLKLGFEFTPEIEGL